MLGLYDITLPSITPQPADIILHQTSIGTSSMPSLKALSVLLEAYLPHTYRRVYQLAYIVSDQNSNAFDFRVVILALFPHTLHYLLDHLIGYFTPHHLEGAIAPVQTLSDHITEVYGISSLCCTFISQVAAVVSTPGLVDKAWMVIDLSIETFLLDPVNLLMVLITYISVAAAFARSYGWEVYIFELRWYLMPIAWVLWKVFGLDIHDV